MQYNDYYYNGHWSYKYDYENSLTTCGPGEVCQTQVTFYGSGGNIYNMSVVKGCNEALNCTANNGLCKSCIPSIPTPMCTSCCTTSFCNYNFINPYIRPPICPRSPCESGPCLNGGWCYNTNYNSSLVAYTSYYCRCPPFWGGQNCETNRSLCANNTCLNGGICYDYGELGEGQFRCNCTPPFVGDRCEFKRNLTCNSSDANYYSMKGRVDYYWYFPGVIPDSCTSFSTVLWNKPEYGYTDPLSQQVCPGSEGKAAAVRHEFEIDTCAAGSIYEYFWDSVHSCCYNVSKCPTGVNPCLNGGTCYDYSTITPGDNYRCECQAGFVGDNCELQSNLTCSSTSPASVKKPTNGPNYMYTTMNCSAAADAYRNNPQSVPYNHGEFVFTFCEWAFGNVFRQGVDGQVASDQYQFELTYCGRNDHTTYMQFRGCCPGCMSAPCQNGGYCVQIDAVNFVCKCTFGFNGRFCENRLSICAVSGDPHYLTFDRKRIDYQGTCKQNLASSVNSSQLNGLEYFNVYFRSVNRNGITSVSYPLYVEVVYNGTAVRLVAGGPSPTAIPVTALVDGTLVQIPYSNSLFNVYYEGTTVRCDTDFGLSVTFDGTWVATVNIPSFYNGLMTGMCGNSDLNPDNDLTTATGLDVSSEVNAFNMVGDSYVVQDPEQPDMSLCPAPPQPPPCTDIPASYSAQCGLLSSTSGIFFACVKRLGQTVANDYADMCIMDACFTQGLSICSSIKAFVDNCAFIGSQVPCSTWQSATGCGGANYCPPGMTYQCSAPACLATCTDPNAPNACSQPNKDSCVCPPGQLLYNGTCTESCPTGCLVENQQLILVGSSWPGPGCTVKSCESCENCTQPGEIITKSACSATEKCIDEQCYSPTPPTTPPTTTKQQCHVPETPKPTKPPVPPTPKTEKSEGSEESDKPEKPKKPEKRTCTPSKVKICKKVAANPISHSEAAKCTNKHSKSCGERIKKRISWKKMCIRFNHCKD